MISDKRCWYTDGDVETLVFPGKEIPEGMWPGRKPFHVTHSKEHMEKIAQALRGRKHTEKHKEKISNSLKERYKEFGPWNKGQKPNSGTFKKGSTPWNKGMTYKECHRTTKKEMTLKIFDTKHKNNSFNKSEPEEIFYDILCSMCGKDNVLRQYSDERYEFACDFYVITTDSFIELNLHPSHNNHPFDENNPDDILELEQLKSNNDGWSNMIADVWSVRDVLKRKTAIMNNLKYFMIYDKNDFNKIAERATTIES